MQTPRSFRDFGSVARGFVRRASVEINRENFQDDKVSSGGGGNLRLLSDPL